jgi:hypothetical protein
VIKNRKSSSAPQPKPEIQNKGVDKDIVTHQTDLSGTILLLPDMLSGTYHNFLLE